MYNTTDAIKHLKKHHMEEHQGAERQKEPPGITSGVVTNAK